MCFFFFFNDTATTEIYTLSLHDALPISSAGSQSAARSTRVAARPIATRACDSKTRSTGGRSEEHTSELQSQSNLVCRLLLEKKKNIDIIKILNSNILCHLALYTHMTRRS